MAAAKGVFRPFTPQTDTLKEVTVTSKKIPAKSKSLTPTQIFTKEDLERRNSLSVADAVRYFSGVQLKDYGGIGGLKTINVRSLGANHSAVLYDGIPLGNAQNGQIDLSKLSLDNIETIELYNGENTGEIQTARSVSAASSLYLKSREPHFEGNENTHGKISFKTGSFGLINPAILLQQKLTGNINASINLEWQKANGMYAYRGYEQLKEQRSNADINAWRIEAGLSGEFKDSSEWALKAYNYKSERGLPAAIITNNLGTARLWDSDTFIQSTYKKAYSELFKLMLNAKYFTGSTHYVDKNFGGSTLDNQYNQDEYYISAAAEYKFTPWWKASLSTDMIRNGMGANISRFADPTRYTSLTALTSTYNYRRITIYGSLLSTLVKEQVKMGNTALSKQILSPSISAAWAPANSGFSFRGFYKNIFRMPTFNDLYYTNIGSTDLKPEYTEQYDLGLTYSKAFSKSIEYITFHTDAYINTVKDKIVAMPTGNLFQWSMVNLGRANITGVEAGAGSAVKLSAELNLTAALNYTYQKALDVTPNTANYNDFIPYTPQHTGSGFLGLAYKKCQFNYNYMYTGYRYSLRPNIYENYLQPWYTHDVSVAMTNNYHHAPVKIQAEVNNLFNKPYQVVRNYPMPGRSYRLSLSTSF
jgi:outer membrane cobalamin receptor